LKRKITSGLIVTLLVISSLAITSYTSISATVANQGSFTKIFNVTLYGQLLTTVLADDFNDNVLDTSKWTILSGGGDSSLSETNQRIEIITDWFNRVYLKSAQPIYSTPAIIGTGHVLCNNHCSMV